uniref:Uncharacterized protein n=1 Tax=Rhizophora mucronata TaxID=61149 RepID=A0A2P2Q2F1_RHIMU
MAKLRILIHNLNWKCVFYLFGFCCPPSRFVFSLIVNSIFIG